MERTGRPTATAFHPLPSHINTAIQDPMTANGVHTPSYGGVVSTGVEWDYIVHPDGSRRCVFFPSGRCDFGCRGAYPQSALHAESVTTHVYNLPLSPLRFLPPTITISACSISLYYSFFPLLTLLTLSQPCAIKVSESCSRFGTTVR